MYTVPTSPQSLLGESMTNTSVYISWERPDPPNGLITNYAVSINLHILLRYTLYHMQISHTFDDEEPSTITITASEATVYYLLTGLRPGTQYQISVMASTSVGQGAAAKLSATTFNSKIIDIVCSHHNV